MCCLKQNSNSKIGTKMWKNIAYLNASEDGLLNHRLWQKRPHIQDINDFSRKQLQHDDVVYENWDGLLW